MRSTPRRLRSLSAFMALGLVMSACGGDGSLQEAGNTTIAASTTAAAITVPPGSPTTTTAPATTPAPVTTVATPLDQLPDCPSSALEGVSSPVEITFWHGMTGELETALTELTESYHASQDRVRVSLQNQGGYEAAFDKFLQTGSSSRPDLLQSAEWSTQALADTGSFVPVDACIEATDLDTSELLPTAMGAYATEGVQWSMPFNVSNPVLYVNEVAFRVAGLDPNDPPRTLEDLREASEAIVSSGAAAYGIALDTNFDSGGGWFVEQWFAKAGEFYADNDNGRSAPATKVLFDGPTGVEVYTFLQDLVADGLAVNVGDNASGQDTFLKMADPTDRAAMTIGTSAALGTVLAALGGGLAPGLGPDDITVGPMPGPSGSSSVLIGGAALWIPDSGDDVGIAAAWDYVSYLVQASSQAKWAAATGYVPIHVDAPELEPLATTYATDPRFRVAYDSLLTTPADPWNIGPLIGPQRELRILTAQALAAVLQGADPATALGEAVRQADAALANYAALQGS